VVDATVPGGVEVEGDGAGIIVAATVGELEGIVVPALGFDEHADTPNVSIANDPAASNAATLQEPKRNHDFICIADLLAFYLARRLRERAL